MEEKIEVTAIFHGRVQGVFFRATAQRYASLSGISGTIENLSDGSVKMVAQGTRPELEKLIETIKNHPGEADISSVDLKFGKINLPYKDFSVKR